jgi:hypothetical protein
MSNRYLGHSYSYSGWHEFYPILCTFNRRRELRRLVAWAERKKLRAPLAAYKGALAFEDSRLSYIARQSPRLTVAAHVLYAVSTVLFPPLRYLKKGSATSFRRTKIRRLTRDSNL